MEFKEQLDLHIRSRYPILWIATTEEERVEGEISALAQRMNPPRQLLFWDYVQGYAGRGEARGNPVQALEQIQRTPSDAPVIFILRDFHVFMSQPEVCRMLRNLARVLRRERKSIIILSPVLKIPPEVEEEITVLDFPFPNDKEIEKEMDLLLQGQKVRLEAGSKEALIKACQGLTMCQIRQVLAKSIAKDGVLDESHIPLVLEEKKQRVRRTEVLDFYPATETLEDIGGLDILKEWLRKRSRSFTEEARRYGLPNAKGILLVGVQGTGKSLSAKAISRLWNLPLLRLDVGRLMGSLVGESESKTREMIKLAEAMAPCVLWIDELDKAFSGVGSGFQGDSGTSSRVFGTIITWMQEKTSPVFIAATANNISALPPELLRKGRFDDIFFVDLPSESERAEIFHVHLKKVREHKLRDYDIGALARETQDYSGAEIEQAIIAAMHEGYDERRDFTTADIMKCIGEMVPLSRTAEEQVEALRKWAAGGRARPASGGAVLPRVATVAGAGGIVVDLPGGS